MTDTQIMKEFRDTGALLDGHFELRSKLHSNRYFQCANLLQFPRIAEKLCKEAVRRAKAAGFDGKADAVVSPAIGGILVGHEVARALGVKCIFAEKVLTKGVDATGKPLTSLAMRRFRLVKGARYVIAEDVVTMGGRVQETIDLVKAAGGKIVGVIVLVDRSAGKVKFPRIPMYSLIQMTPEVWTPSTCPLCEIGSKPVHPGS